MGSPQKNAGKRNYRTEKGIIERKQELQKGKILSIIKV